LTITAGRFLTPFGIFNERISASGLIKFQDAPAMAAIGIAGGYSDGFMLRAALDLNDRYVVNYATYFSTLSTVNKLESERTLVAGWEFSFLAWGSRWGLLIKENYKISE